MSSIEIHYIAHRATADEIAEACGMPDYSPEAAVRDETVTYDSLADAADGIRSEGLSFDASGADWAAHPDGTTVVDYRTGMLEELTAHVVTDLDPADFAALHQMVDASC